MNKEKENQRPGGDRVIKHLRTVGDVLEHTVLAVLTSAAIVEVFVILIRLATDLRIKSNKSKMKGGKDGK